MILQVEHGGGAAFISYDSDADRVGRDVSLKSNNSAT